MYLPARALILLYPRNRRFYFISLQLEEITGSTNLSPSREDYIRYIDRAAVQFSVIPYRENSSIDNSSHDSTFRIFSFHEVCEFSFLQEAPSIQIYRICIQKPRACFTRFDHRGFLFFALPSYRNRSETNGGGSRWPGETRRRCASSGWEGCASSVSRSISIPLSRYDRLYSRK